MKIGIMGGTFDPIHNGHLMLGEYAYRQFTLDKIWFMPNGNPPHKASENIESQTKHRVEMVKLAIQGKDYFELQSYEVETKDVHYSYKTMEHFCKMYPEDEFYFIIGADSLFSIEKWRCPERLVKLCTILAAYRDEKGTEEMLSQIQYINEKYGADIRLLNTPNVDISSTDIRKALKQETSAQKGQLLREFLPEAVINYIETKELYKDDENGSGKMG